MVPARNAVQRTGNTSEFGRDDNQSLIEQGLGRRSLRERPAGKVPKQVCHRTIKFVAVLVVVGARLVVKDLLVMVPARVPNVNVPGPASACTRLRARRQPKTNLVLPVAISLLLWSW